MSSIKGLESNHQTVSILRCKVVVIGDACVGKTALCQVFESNGQVYPKNYLMTIGADFTVKQIKIPDSQYRVELFIYDCAGQSIFNQLDMNSKYYADAAAIMVVYSIGSRESLQTSAKWYASVRGTFSSSSPPFGVLVGNKSDFRDGTANSRAEVTESEGRQLANELNLQFFETSALNNTGVEDPFKYIAEMFIKRYEDSGQSLDDFNKMHS